MRDKLPGYGVLGICIFVLLSCSRTNGPESTNHRVLARIAVDTATVQSGRIFDLPVLLTQIASDVRAIDSISSFTITFDYDNTLLQFNGASLGSAVPDWSGLGTHGGGLNNLDRSRTTIRLGARRKLGDEPMPWGEIAKLSFQALPFVGLTPRTTEIEFEFRECSDNTLGDGANDSLLHFPRYQRIGDSIIEVADSSLCARRTEINADLELVAGSIVIEPDTVIRVRGDLSGNGAADVVDVVQCLSAVARGDSGFCGGTAQREQRLRDLDVNGDGLPAQVSDLEILIRLTFRNLNPNQPFWPVLTSALFEFQPDPSGVNVVLQSETPITMLLLDIRRDPGTRLTFDYGSAGLAIYELIETDSNTVVIYDDLLGGGIANPFRPFELRIRIAPGERVCLQTIQASTRPGIAVPVHTKTSDRCN